MFHRNTKNLIALVTVATLCSGCQSLRKGEAPAIVKKLDIPTGVPWKAEKPPQPGVPSRIVTTWTDTVLQSTGKPSQRGFGGRLFFYSAKEAKPIPVEGQLVIYAFDETDRKPTDNKPTKRYVFPPDQFAKHQSDSEFGISYSIWLPWDEVGGAAKDVSLIARFEPLTGGALVVSDQTRERLPGRMQEGPIAAPQIAKTKLSPSIRQVTHNSAVPQASSSAPAASMAPERQMETTTIKLPNKATRPSIRVGGAVSAGAFY